MEGGYLAMSPRERSRLVMMTRVREKAITIKETAEVMGMSYRQSRRIYKRYRGEGDRGLIHQARGQPSNRGKDCKVDGSIHIAYRNREVLFTEIKEFYPESPWLLIKSNKTLNQRGNMSLLQIIPGEDTASNLNAPAKHYLYEVTKRGHF